MRVAIFVVVVAAHVILLLFFLSKRPVVVRGSEADVWATLMFFEPAPPEPVPLGLRRLAESQHREKRAAQQEDNKQQMDWLRLDQQRVERRDGGQPPVEQVQAEQEWAEQPQWPQQLRQSPFEWLQADQSQAAPSRSGQQAPALQTPDWRSQAELTAQIEAREIVDAQDAAERRANALTSGFKPLPLPRVRGPEFAWGYASHRVHHIPNGPWIYAINEHCQMLIFIIPFVGCQIGKIEARGDLFKNMHPPVKYGDWDWRVKDP